MTKAKHTPGPWVVGHPYGWYGRTFTPIGLTHSQAGGRVTKQIAAVGHGRKQTLKVTEELQEMANAHLIAAAPEMLAGLKSIVSWAEKNNRWDKTEWSDVYAAIAKAEGAALTAGQTTGGET